jgi:hypothetical protein
MPARLDDKTRQTVGGDGTADGGFGRDPQYSLLNFFVYAVIAFILLFIALAVVPSLTGNFHNSAPADVAPINARPGFIQF